MLTRRWAVCSACMAFGIALVAGAAAGNPAETSLARALWAMLGFYFLGSVAGSVGDLVVDERNARLRQEAKEKREEEARQAEEEAGQAEEEEKTRQAAEAAVAAQLAGQRKPTGGDGTGTENWEVVEEPSASEATREEAAEPAAV